MQVNMLEAKNQLSRLVKAALAGEEAIIASHGNDQVKLVACSSAVGLRHPGALLGAMAAAADQGTPGHQGTDRCNRVCGVGGQYLGGVDPISTGQMTG